MSPKLIQPASRNVSAVLKEITPGELYEVTVTIRPPYALARVRADVKFDTGVAESPTGSVAVYASIKPRVLARPRRISVPASPSAGWERRVSLVWDDKKPHRITGATVDDPRMQVRIHETANRQRVVLRMLDGYQPKPGTRAIMIETDDGEASRVRVPVVVAGAPRSVRRKGTKPGS